jgi:hypothetical protein
MFVEKGRDLGGTGRRLSIRRIDLEVIGPVGVNDFELLLSRSALAVAALTFATLPVGGSAISGTPIYDWARIISAQISET